MEWTERPSHVDLETLAVPTRLGPLPEGTVLVATEVAVVLIPADTKRKQAPAPGISTLSIPGIKILMPL